MIRYAYRLPLLALGMIALFSALWGGLLRLGLSLPLGPPTLAGFHGPLMISGFLGTLIGLERAVGVGKLWAYGVPVLSGAGVLALLFGLPEAVSASLMVLSSLILVLLFLNIYLRQPALFTLVMGAGAMLWLFGNFLWLMEIPLPRVVLWWGGFLVLTISGERLELARLGFLSGRSRISFQIALIFLLAGLVVSLKLFDSGVRLTGIGLIALSIWLLTYDIARRTIRQRGLTRFIATSLLLGQLWLGVAGILALWYGGSMSGFSYDAVLHSLFLGFVFSMIFGHAPIIFPAILGTPLMYHPRFYIHLVLLHLTLILRIGSDLTEWASGRKWGGLLNGLVIVLFLANTVYSLFRSRTASHPSLHQ